MFYKLLIVVFFIVGQVTLWAELLGFWLIGVLVGHGVVLGAVLADGLH